MFRKSRFVLFFIRFHKSGFSFASSLIERVIKDIFSTLMYVCVKRNICLNLWLANILDLFFVDVIITLFFSDVQFIALSLRGSVKEMLVHVHVLVNAQ